MKWTRRVPRLGLPSSDSARLAHMLEHDLLTWEWDMNETHRLSGGHSLLAFGWALIERHGLRVLDSTRLDSTRLDSALIYSTLDLT